MSLAEKRAARFNVAPGTLNNLIFFMLAAYVVAGRIFFIAAHLSAFSRTPADLISFNVSLFDALAALASAVLAGLAYGQRRKLSLWPTLDAVTPFLASLAVGLGFSHLASGQAFGRETDLPWAITLWGSPRHPTQVYEIVAALLILCLVWFGRTELLPGQTFVLFASISAASRLLLEAFRADSTLVFGGLRAAQIIAWIILAVALVLYDRLERRSKPLPAIPVTKPRRKSERPKPGLKKLKSRVKR